MSQAALTPGRAEPVEAVQLWRPAGQERVLLMRGWTAAYAVDSSSEYFIGVVGAHSMLVTRGRARHLVHPGELVVWDPSQAHAGTPAEHQPWLGRLMVIELPDLTHLDDDDLLPDLEFPHPVIRDPGLVSGFVAMHRAMTRPSPTLGREVALAEWLGRLLAHSPSMHSVHAASVHGAAAGRRACHDDPAFRRACAYLQENLATNTSLDELARAAGVGKFRLIRLFRDATGLPPHRFQLAQRIKLARRLLERGTPVGEVAVATGFVDQSHLHRHFRRGLGLTPKQYVDRLVR